MLLSTHMEYKEILFATTNDNKIERLHRLIGDLPVKILTLSDLPTKIDEPEEYGETALDIAKNKAAYYWEKINGEYPVLTQDDTVDFLGNVAPEDDPSISIKAPVIKVYGEFTIPNAIDYYSKLAEKYGGEVEFVFRYGHGFAEPKGVKGNTSVLYARLVKEPRGVEQVGKYPLRALTKIKIGDNYVYSSDASVEERTAADSDLKRAVLELLSV